jgi:SAM-dependent methyltransferase
MENYWDTRYSQENKIWGESPSRTARRALDLFRRNNIRKLLVPGSGYGRNTKVFSDAGFEATGVEISDVAAGLAREFDPLSRCYCASVLDMSFLNDIFDAVYCFNTLHLFREKERKTCIDQCLAKVAGGGLLYFTVFSENEPSFGKGQEVEENTFESKPGRPAHYFTEDDLKSHFSGTDIIETGLAEDREDHGGEGPHTHVLRYIIVRKTIKV